MRDFLEKKLKSNLFYFGERKRLLNEHVSELEEKAYAQNTSNINYRDRISTFAQKIASANRECKEFDFESVISA